MTLVLTHRCNLACTYCYAGEKFSRSMSLRTGWEAIRLAFAQTPPGEAVSVSFFGGEPMLEFPLLLRLTRLARRLAEREGLPIRFDMTTNGTVLTEQHLRFLYTYDFNLAVSVDGWGRGNQERPMATGGSSAPVVWDNLARAAAYLDRLSVLMVVTPASLPSLVESVHALQALKVTRISLLPEVSRPWPEEAWEKAHEVFAELAREGAVDPFLRSPVKPCGFGTEEITVSPAGRLYPCARLVGTDSRPEVQIGDLRSGIDPERLAQIKACSRERMVDSPCGCVPLMPGRQDLQLQQYRRFGQLVEACS